MLPAGAELKSVEPGWECTADGQKITCSRASLAKGASATLVLLTSMTQRGSATNAVNVATTSYEQNTANNSSQATVRVNRAAQTAKALPASPTRVKAGKTKQGQKLRTRVICRPKKFAAAGEVAFCKVTRRAGEVRIQVVGSKTMKVTVIQRAKATPRYKRFVQRKTYIVKP
jgi:hypothetical protein